MHKNIAILCSGGDVSGMNPALKRFVEYALEKRLQPFFVYNGYNGLIDNTIIRATYADVTGIIVSGGTKIRSARSQRFLKKKYRKIAKKNLNQLQINMLIVLGGDGSFRGLHTFYKESGIKICGIPATIDNDIATSDYSLGVDTALNIIKTSIDAIRDTASSFSRAFVIQTMGRNCGYLALVSGLTSGAELVLIPEKKYDLHSYEKKFTKQISHGRKYFIAIVAEGIHQTPQEIATWFETKIGIESKAIILGHVQRGGTPSTYDRLMAYRFVDYAIDGLLNNKNDTIICHNKNNFTYESINKVTKAAHTIDKKLLEML